MLLTLSNPVKPDFDYKPHDYSPAFSSPTAARFSPKLKGGPLLSQATSSSFAMGTPQPHRGLPPPSAMTLPDPGRGPPSIQSTLGSMPPAPSQWQGAEDGMKNWLAAKAEEERRKQEEEKTRQESLKLEQRKVEQSILRESMQGGVPPHLVPIIFAGIGGGNLANISAEWIQQYTAQVQAAHQQVQVQTQSQLSPDLRRDARIVGPPQATVYAGQPQTPQTIMPPSSVLPGQPLPPSQQYTTGPPMSPRARAVQAAPTSAPRPPLPQSQLPRLSTNEMQIQQPPTAGVQQLSQTQIAQQESSSPQLYFHHWIPPASEKSEKSSGNPPATPSGKYKASPVAQTQARQRAMSHASDIEHTSSPKKRKAQGHHQPAPPPSSAPPSSAPGGTIHTSAPPPTSAPGGTIYTSPSFSHVSSSSTSTPGYRGHARARSDASRGPEPSSASVSRRGTVSGGHAHETIVRHHGDIPEEPRLAGSAEGKLPSSEQAYATPPLGRGHGGQSYAPSGIQSQPETPKYGPGPQHQHWDREYMSSPKREVGDH